MSERFTQGMSRQLGAADICELIRGSTTRALASAEDRMLLAEEGVSTGKLASFEINMSAGPRENSAAIAARDDVLGRISAFLPPAEGVRLLVFAPEREAEFTEAFYRHLGKRLLPNGGDRSELCTPLGEAGDKAITRQIKKLFPSTNESDLFAAQLHGHLWACHWPNDVQPKFKHLARVRPNSWQWPSRLVGEPTAGASMP